jgi:hypothetical protein
VELANVIRKYFRLDPRWDDIYENIDISYEGEWEFINNSKSEQFRTIEYVSILYKYKHDAFLNHFLSLKDMSIQLIKDIREELESRK